MICKKTNEQQTHSLANQYGAVLRTHSAYLSSSKPFYVYYRLFSLHSAHLLPVVKQHRNYKVEGLRAVFRDIFLMNCNLICFQRAEVQQFGIPIYYDNTKSFRHPDFSHSVLVVNNTVSYLVDRARSQLAINSLASMVVWQLVAFKIRLSVCPSSNSVA